MGGVKLYQCLSRERVLIAPAVTNRDELLTAFAELFAGAAPGLTAGRIVGALLEREQILSTGIGRGVAVPHAQIDGLHRLFMAVSTHPAGIDYPSVDDLPVRLAFCLLGGADSAPDHLAGLARIARRARRPERLEPLILATSGDDLIRTLSRLEGGE